MWYHHLIFHEKFRSPFNLISPLNNTVLIFFMFYHHLTLQNVTIHHHLRKRLCKNTTYLYNKIDIATGSVETCSVRNMVDQCVLPKFIVFSREILILKIRHCIFQEIKRLVRLVSITIYVWYHRLTLFNKIFINRFHYHR